jgi:hypothetical protein
MANKKKKILPVVLMLDDDSSTSKDAFILALRQLDQNDLVDKANKKAVFEAGLLINPWDYVPGLGHRKNKSLTTLALADQVKGLRKQLKAYEAYLRKQNDQEVDVCTLIRYICKKKKQN